MDDPQGLRDEVDRALPAETQAAARTLLHKLISWGVELERRIEQLEGVDPMDE